MAEYIPKSVLVAEIEKRIKTNKECMLGLRNLDYYQGKVDTLNDTISFLNTLEVKEVDLEKELGILDNAYFEFNGVMVKGTAIVEEMKVIARHFFELGMAVSNKAQKGEKV